MVFSGLTSVFVAVLALFSASVQGWGGLQYCGASTFTNRVSAGSPKMADCEYVMHNLVWTENQPDSWLLGTCYQRTIFTWGSCSFSIEADDRRWNLECHEGNTNPVFRIGWGDIVYVLNQSFIQFGTNGLVGAEGYMECYPDDDSGHEFPKRMKWGIF